MREQLMIRRRELETRIGILKEEMKEKRSLQHQGIAKPEPRMMRGYREEIAELKTELLDVSSALTQFKADPRNDINHWFRQAAYETLDHHQYTMLSDRARVMCREYQAGPIPEPAEPAVQGDGS